MLSRTGKKKADYNLTNGPGKLSKALGVNMSFNGVSFRGNSLWIEDKGVSVKKQDIHIGPRIGVEYAEEDSLLPYRYLLRHDDYIHNIP